MSDIRKVSTRDLTSNKIKFQQMHGLPRRIEIAILFGKGDSDHMSGDLLVFEDTSLTYKMPYDDLQYIIEGKLELETEEGTTISEPGDVVWIPTGQELTFKSKGKTVASSRRERLRCKPVLAEKDPSRPCHHVACGH